MIHYDPTTLEEHEDGNVTDTSAEGLHTWAKTVRMQQHTSARDDRTYVAPGRSAGNAELHGRPSGLYASATLRRVLENLLQKKATRRMGDSGGMKSNCDSITSFSPNSIENGQGNFMPPITADHIHKAPY